MYFPAAFDEPSQTVIEKHTRAGNRLEVGPADALDFACNAIQLERSLVTNAASEKLQTALKGWGYSVHTTPLSEFMKAGGAAKCLALMLD